MDFARFRFTAMVAIGLLGFVDAGLKKHYYAKSCPGIEKKIKSFVSEHIKNAPSLAAPLIRMQFHDCFVRGCDGSVLLNSTSKNQAEKEAAPNLTLRGFDFIDSVKSMVEDECKGVVSCADILSLVARDASVAAGGPGWTVSTGRRDGNVSSKTEAAANIPAPTSNLSHLNASFANQTLNLNDLVILSGAHTIGVSHCSSFSARLYNFSKSIKQDPSLDKEYAGTLKSKCKNLNDNVTIVEMDPGSRRTFDTSYYKLLLKRRGLFQSDAALITKGSVRKLVSSASNFTRKDFFRMFAKSMEKMIQINVKTGNVGEIRRHCAVVNG